MCNDLIHELCQFQIVLSTHCHFHIFHNLFHVLNHLTIHLRRLCHFCISLLLCLHDDHCYVLQSKQHQHIFFSWKLSLISMLPNQFHCFQVYTHLRNWNLLLLLALNCSLDCLDHTKKHLRKCYFHLRNLLIMSNYIVLINKLMKFTFLHQIEEENVNQHERHWYCFSKFSWSDHLREYHSFYSLYFKVNILFFIDEKNNLLVKLFTFSILWII